MKSITVTSATIPTATGTLTGSNTTNVSNNDTVTIGAVTYTFKTSLTASTTANEVLIAGSGNSDSSLLNLIRAINQTGTPGTDYGSATVIHPTVTAASSVTSNAFLVTARESGTDGNAIATTEVAAVLSWGAATLTGGADTIAIAGTIADTTYTQPSVRVTVNEFQAGNTAWSRNIRITNQGVFCLRNGSSSVALTLASFGTIGRTVEPSLTWAPKITTQPSADDCVQSSTAATFTVVASSEPAMTYLWQYSTDDETWIAASGTINGCVYTNGTTATLTCTPTTTGQTGKYHRCVVTNAAGSTNSDSAILTIT